MHTVLNDIFVTVFFVLIKIYKKTQKSSNYLVSLNSPDFDDPLVQVEHVELVLLVEDGAAVRPGVVGEVQAGGVRLRQEVADVAEAGQGFPEKLEVIDFLEADDVGVVSGDLLQHPETAGAPVQGGFRASHELVVLGADRCQQNLKVWS